MPMNPTITAIFVCRLTGSFSQNHSMIGMKIGSV